MAPGAVVAIIAAAHAEKIKEVLAAFRAAGATAPATARSLAELGLAHEAQVKELISAGVLVPGRTEGLWYLSEEGERRRELTIARKNRQAVKVIAIVLGVALLAGIALLLLRSSGGNL